MAEASLTLNDGEQRETSAFEKLRTGTVHFVSRDLDGAWAVIEFTPDEEERKQSLLHIPPAESPSRRKSADQDSRRGSGQHSRGWFTPRAAPPTEDVQLTEDKDEEAATKDYAFLHYSCLGNGEERFTAKDAPNEEDPEGAKAKGRPVRFRLGREETEDPLFPGPKGASFRCKPDCLWISKAWWDDGTAQPGDSPAHDRSRNRLGPVFMWHSVASSARKERALRAVGFNLFEKDLEDQVTRVSDGDRTRLMDKLGVPLYVMSLCWHMRRLQEGSRRRSSMIEQLSTHDRRHCSQALKIHVDTTDGVMQVELPEPPFDKSLLAHLCFLGDDSRCNCDDARCSERPHDYLRGFPTAGSFKAYRQLAVDIIEELNKLWREREPDEVLTVDPITGRLISVDEFCKHESQGVLEAALRLGQADIVRAMVGLQYADDTSAGMRASAPMPPPVGGVDATGEPAARGDGQAAMERSDRMSELGQGGPPAFDMVDPLQAISQQHSFIADEREDYRRRVEVVSRDLWLSTWHIHELGSVMFFLMENYGLSVAHPGLLDPCLRAVQGIRCLQDKEEACEELRLAARQPPSAGIGEDDLSTEMRREAELRIKSIGQGGGECWGGIVGRDPGQAAECAPSDADSGAYSLIMTAPHFPPGWDALKHGGVSASCDDDRCYRWPGESLLHYRIRRRCMVILELLISQVALPGYDRFGLFPTSSRHCTKVRVPAEARDLQDALSKYGVTELNSDLSVCSVERKSAARNEGIAPRSVLVRLDGRLVTSLHQAQDEYEAVKDRCTEPMAPSVELVFAHYGYHRGSFAAVLQRTPWILNNKRVSDGLAGVVEAYIGLEDEVLNPDEIRRLFHMHEDMTLAYHPRYKPMYHPTFVRLTRRLHWQVSTVQVVPGKEENWCAVGLDCLDWGALLSSPNLMELGAKLRGALDMSRTGSSKHIACAVALELDKPWSMVRTAELESAGGGRRPDDRSSAGHPFFCKPRSTTFHSSLYLAAYGASMRTRVLEHLGRAATRLWEAYDPGNGPEPMHIVLRGGKTGDKHLSARRFSDDAIGKRKSAAVAAASHLTRADGTETREEVALCSNALLYGGSAVAQLWRLWHAAGHSTYHIESYDSMAARDVQEMGGQSKVLLAGRRRGDRWWPCILLDDKKGQPGSVGADDIAEWVVEPVGVGGTECRYMLRLAGHIDRYLMQLPDGSEELESDHSAPHSLNLHRRATGLCIGPRGAAGDDFSQWSIPGLSHEADPSEVAVTFGHRETMLTILEKYGRLPTDWRGRGTTFGVWAGECHDVALLMRQRLEKIDGEVGTDHLDRIIEDLHGGTRPGTQWVKDKLVTQAYKIGCVQSLPFFLLLVVVTFLGLWMTRRDFYWAHEAVREAALGAEYNAGHEYVPNAHWSETFEDVEEINVMQEWFSTAFMGKILRGWAPERTEDGVLKRGHGGEGGAPYQPGFYGAWRLVGSIRVGQQSAVPGTCSYPGDGYYTWLRDNQAQYPCFDTSGFTAHPLELYSFYFPRTERHFPIMSFREELMMHPRDLRWPSPLPQGTKPSHPDLDLIINGTWINPNTRYVCVQFVSFSPAMDIFVVAELCFEVLPTGVVSPRAQFTPVLLHESGMLAIASVFFVLGGILALFEIRDFLSACIIYCQSPENTGPHERRRPLVYRALSFIANWLTDDGNGYDIAIVCMVFLTAVLMIEQESTRDSLRDPRMLDPENRIFYTDFLRLSRQRERTQTIVSWLTVLCWFKVPMTLRYVPIIGPTIYTITAVFTSVPEVYSFVALFCVYLFTFYLGWYVAGSSYYEGVSSMSKAFFSVFRMIFADWDDFIFDALKRQHSSTLFLFVIMVFFVTIFFLNIFIAVLQEAYTSVRKPGVYEQSLARLHIEFELLVPRSVPQGGSGKFSSLLRQMKVFFLGAWVTEIPVGEVGWQWQRPVSALAEDQFAAETARLSTVAGDVAEMQKRVVELILERQEADKATMDRLSQLRDELQAMSRKNTEMHYELRTLAERVPHDMEALLVGKKPQKRMVKVGDVSPR
eukprot:TRINITY_DN3807_c0_g2_i1.p1 TRINITY_DN3807_c0_g2~~TRINITY_DN3807_c0_g2_i1.p1  ORF type:complete len:2052 (+),score=445.42 TRINITY_DN3807_c0_g2_i1:85-6156(+)